MHDCAPCGQSQLWSVLGREHVGRWRDLRGARAGAATEMPAVLGGVMRARPCRGLWPSLLLRTLAACTSSDGCGHWSPTGRRCGGGSRVCSKHATTLLCIHSPAAILRMPTPESHLCRTARAGNLLTFTSKIEVACGGSRLLGALAATAGMSSAPVASVRGELVELGRPRRIGLFSRQGHVSGRGSPPKMRL